MTEWEILACAAEMRTQHGADAVMQAAMRIDAMFKDKDRAGHWAWCRILMRITMLGPATDEHATKH